MTDREKVGLRGPVKSCVEETGKRLATTEHGLDGRLLSPAPFFKRRNAKTTVPWQ